jgi:hypothetical protein
MGWYSGMTPHTKASAIAFDVAIALIAIALVVFVGVVVL